MINMAVISLKDIIKYLVKITIIITIVVGLTRYFLSVKNNKENNSSIEKSSEAEVISENNSKDINKSSSEVKRENQSESKGTNEDQNENNKQLGLENNWQNFLSCLDISIPAISQIFSSMACTLISIFFLFIFSRILIGFLILLSIDKIGF